MKKTILKTGLAVLIVSSPISVYAGIQGNCVDCHTMHNSELHQLVAQSDGASSASISSLLKSDCIGCHAQNTANSIENNIPQVYHRGNDLAAGNFAYIDGTKGTASDRKGHNVTDLFTADNDNFDANGAPPGNAFSSIHGAKFGVPGSEYENFTCAGTLGCHGTRSQIVSDGDIGNDNELAIIRREGMDAIHGAHHANTDGAKTSDGYTAASVHNGAVVAAGYRFIPGLKGFENTTDRWQNLNATNHNEYFGDATPIATNDCGTCHIQGNNYGTEGGLSSRMTTDSTLQVPNNSMSGFCATCHGMFHSAGTENGTSGAFLRHPSDYALDSTHNTEYGDYTTYSVNAPVARAAVAAPSATVTDQSDMVMCLSCHKPHASQYDYILRFDYTTQTAGTGTAAGCLTCHNNKGL